MHTLNDNIKRKAVYFDITPNCNLRCVHCYNAEKYFFNGFSNEISLNEAKNIVYILNQNGFNYIHFLGGEPLLYKHILELISYCKELNYIVSINTNATLLNDTLQDQLIALNVDQIGCSLDGYDDETNDRIRGKGTFYKVIQNIKSLTRKKSNIQVQLVYTITNTNCHQIELLPPLLEWLGVDIIDVSLLFEAGNAISAWEKIKIEDIDLFNAIERFIVASKNKKYIIQIDNRPILAYYLKLKYSDVEIITNIDFITCSAGKKNIYIEADGKIHPCNYFVAIGGREKYKELGIPMRDLLLSQNSFSEIKESPYFSFFLHEVETMDVRDKRNDCCKCFCRSICYPCPFEYNNRFENKICVYCLNKLKEYFSPQNGLTIHIKSTSVFSELAKLYINTSIDCENEIIGLSDLSERSGIVSYELIDFLIELKKLNIININIKEK